MSSTLQITNIGTVIRLATESAPTKAQAQASKGYVSLLINANDTRKFSISQHYDTDFTNGGFTLDDVLAPNTSYKIYLFFEANAIPSETTIEGATLANDVVALSFTTATLPVAGDAVWGEALGTTVAIINLKEYHFMENQTGVIVFYFQITNPIFVHVASARDSEDDTTYRSIGSYTASNGMVRLFSNYYYNYGGITGYTSDYGYFIVSEKLPIIKISFQSTHTDFGGGSIGFRTPVSRY